MDEDAYEDLLRYEDEIYKEQNSSSDSEEDFIKDPSIIYSQIFYTSEKPKFITEKSITEENQKEYSNKQVIEKEGIKEENGREEKTAFENGNEKKKVEYILISSDSEDEERPKAITNASNGSLKEESKYFISRRELPPVASINKVSVDDPKYSSDEIELGEIIEEKIKSKPEIENKRKPLSPSPPPQPPQPPPTSVLSTPIKNNVKMVTTPLETHIISPIDFKTFDTRSSQLTSDDKTSTSSQEGPSKHSKMSDRNSRDSRSKQNACQNCGSRSHEESVCSSIMYPENDQNTWRKYKLKSPPKNVRPIKKSCFRCASRDHFGWDCRDYKSASSYTRR